MAEYIQTWLLGLLILNYFHSNHHSLSSYVSQMLRVCLLFHPFKFFQQKCSYLLRFLVVLFLLHHIEYFWSNSTLKWPCSERWKIIMMKRISYLSSSNHSWKWLAICYSLGHNNNIRLQSLPFESPSLFSYSIKSSLNLIWDIKPTMLLQNCINSLNIVLWQRDYSSCTHDWLNP